MSAKNLFAIIAVFLPLMAAAQSVAPPPQPLHFVNDHWTPYDPPTEFPEGAMVHTIVKGDTLWDLAAHYLGDPFLWPQIWERNPYIKDSHWIYPGDPVVVDLAVQEAPVAATDVPFEETVTSEYVEDFGGGDEITPRPLGSSADVYCFAELVQDEGIFPFTVASSEQIAYQDSYSEGRRPVLHPPSDPPAPSPGLELEARHRLQPGRPAQSAVRPGGHFDRRNHLRLRPCLHRRCSEAVRTGACALGDPSRSDGSL